MKERYVVLTIDTIGELFKDYVGPEELPWDAKPLKLIFKPTEMGRLALIMDSAYWTEGMPDININFDIKRVYGV
jgi:hypothetical protein